MLLSQVMNASNLARGVTGERRAAAQSLDRAADALEDRVALIRAEAERARDAPRDAVGAEQGKVSMLLGMQVLADAASDISARADRLAATANTPETGASSRMIATALGVSTNTAIKRMRKAEGEGKGA